MEKSKNFYKVKGFYERGLWDKKRVLDAVVRGWIRENERDEIVGEELTAKVNSQDII